MEHRFSAQGSHHSGRKTIFVSTLNRNLCGQRLKAIGWFLVLFLGHPPHLFLQGMLSFPWTPISIKVWLAFLLVSVWVFDWVWNFYLPDLVLPWKGYYIYHCPFECGWVYAIWEQGVWVSVLKLCAFVLKRKEEMRRRKMSLKARVLAGMGRDILRSPPLGSALRGEGPSGRKWPFWTWHLHNAEMVDSY